MIDYLIVGSGLAGIAFAEQALHNNKSILVFDDAAWQSSRVAGGLYNPVVLKRFNSVWNAQEQLDSMNSFYAAIEDKLCQQFHFPIPVIRKFHSIEEQNNWFAAADKPNLSPFLSTDLIKTNYKNINSPFGYGEVLQTGHADTKSLLEAYHHYLSVNGWLRQESFNHSELKSFDDHIEYQSVKARHIVFAEGFGIASNPYFNQLPLEGTKGELFTIKADLDLDKIIKSNVFIVPLGGNLYKVGATYEWTDKTENPTEEGKRQLIEMIKETIDCDFEIVSHKAGIRPTVKDRKPLVGTHPHHKNFHILNGMGTRGVMLAPNMAKLLYDHIESGKTLPSEVDIKRFTL